MKTMILQTGGPACPKQSYCPALPHLTAFADQAVILVCAFSGIVNILIPINTWLCI